MVFLFSKDDLTRKSKVNTAWSISRKTIRSNSCPPWLVALSKHIDWYWYGTSSRLRTALSIGSNSAFSSRPYVLDSMIIWSRCRQCVRVKNCVSFKSKFRHETEAEREREKRDEHDGQRSGAKNERLSETPTDGWYHLATQSTSMSNQSQVQWLAVRTPLTPLFAESSIDESGRCIYWLHCFGLHVSKRLSRTLLSSIHNIFLCIVRLSARWRNNLSTRFFLFW